MTTNTMRYEYSDGGRKAAGFKGDASDCGVRALAIATGISYLEARALIGAQAAHEVQAGRGRLAQRPSSANSGVWVETFHAVMAKLGWRWVPTMAIGSGCTTHLVASELPAGRLIVRLSRHYAAVVDGVVLDTYDPRRNGARCVYGYWIGGAA